MSEPLTFDWTKPEEIAIFQSKNNADEKTETFPADKLDRAKYAEFLTHFLLSQATDKNQQPNTYKNYVINLNSEWGSGKTYFLKRWLHTLKQYYPVVYVDAWKQDYSDDPLMTVVSSMINQLRTLAGKDKEDSFKASKKWIGLFKAAAPGIARGLSKRFLGIDPVEIMQANDDETIESLNEQDNQLTDVKDNPIDMSFAASAAVQHILDEHDAKAMSIEALKASVKEWIGAAIGLNSQEASQFNYPAFVFIDELDRCRPSYAVEMLEVIKHIFDIEGIVFVVATDTEQLQHAIKAVYGEGFDAKLYLGRFFHSRFSLRQADLTQLLPIHCNTQALDNTQLRDKNITLWPINDNINLTIDNISAILNCFNLPPRSAIQVTERVIATVVNLPEDSKLDLLMLTTLLCIREQDESLYQQIVSQRFKQQDGDKEVTLSNYLTTRFNTKAHNIQNHFNPKLITAHLRRSNDGFGYPPENKYPEHNYKAEYNYYINNIFSVHYQNNPALEMLNVVLSRNRHSNNDKKEGKLESIELSLHKKYPNSKSKSTSDYQDIANLWLEYLFFKDELNQIPINYYQDLVELASALTTNTTNTP